MTLIATSRSMRGSNASHTVDCPPCPSTRRNSNRPSVVPASATGGRLLAKGTGSGMSRAQWVVRQTQN